MTKLYVDKKRDLSKLKSKSRTLFPSRKMRASIITECPLEANLCYYFEFDQSVTSYESQPLGYYYMYEGQRHVYTPDFEVFNGSKSFYIEVKSKLELEKFENFDAWFSAVKHQAISLGKDLILRKEQCIRRKPDYQNLIQLYRCLKTNYDYNFLRDIKSKLTANKVLTVGDLIEQQSQLPWIYKLIAEQIIELTPSSQLLTQDATVKWRLHEQNN